MQLRFASFAVINLRRDLHPQECARAGRTMNEEHEPLQTLREQGGWLAHIHLADSGRLNPGTGVGGSAYDYPAFFGHLEAAGYAGLMSCECGLQGEPLAAMRHSFQFLHRQWT